MLNILQKIRRQATVSLLTAAGLLVGFSLAGLNTTAAPGIAVTSVATATAPAASTSAIVATSTTAHTSATSATATTVATASTSATAPTAVSGSYAAGTTDTKAEAAALKATRLVITEADDNDVITSVSGSVLFAVNTTNVPVGSPFIAELRHNILPRITNQGLELCRIEVRGAASPEGSIENNERLAKGRTQAIIDTITSILPTAGRDIMNVASVTEDYEYLIELMTEAHDPDTQFVSDSYNTWKHNIADLKWTLMTYRNRALWNRLLREYFPQLRATRVKLFFRERVPVMPDPCACCGKTECICTGKPLADGTKTSCHCASSDDCECVEKPVCHCSEGTTCVCRTGDRLCQCNQAPHRTCHCTGNGDAPHSSCHDSDGCVCMTDSTTCRCAMNDSIGCYCIPFTTPIVKTKSHRRPVMAISTNLLYDAWYQPDYGFAPMWNGKIEFYPRKGHFTYALGFANPYWHKWNEHKFFQIRNYEIEGRWYHHFDRESGQRWGWYVGAAIDNNIFGIGLSDTRGWQGEGLGGQVTGGYVLPLSRCKGWKLEFNLGAGFYQTNYDPYIFDDPYADSGIHGEYNPPTANPQEPDKLHYYYKWYGSAADFKKRQHRFRWMGPTQIGISLKYDILWKRQGRRGISFRHHEQRKEVDND